MTADPVEQRVRLIRAEVARIPKGRVSTYGRIAQLVGLPGRARLVGRVLRELPDGSRVPWHRVLGAGGRIAFADGSEAHHRQRTRLEREGVRFRQSGVDLAAYGWPDADLPLDELLWKG